MPSFRHFLGSRPGQALAVLLFAAVAALLYASLRSAFGPSLAAQTAAHRTFICAQTGKPFSHHLRAGDQIPVYSPHSRQPTGYPAEFCYWNPDGSIKSNPTPVLLNSFKSLPGPTPCPECGRLVIAHNPVPRPGQSPPPILDDARLATYRITARRD